jgi:hypothetical protein
MERVVLRIDPRIQAQLDFRSLDAAGSRSRQENLHKRAMHLASRELAGAEGASNPACSFLEFLVLLFTQSETRQTAAGGPVASVFGDWDMLWRNAYRGWVSYIGALKRKWSNYSNRIVLVMAEAEMDVQREEILKHVNSERDSRPTANADR